MVFCEFREVGAFPLLPSGREPRRGAPRRPQGGQAQPPRQGGPTAQRHSTSLCLSSLHPFVALDFPKGDTMTRQPRSSRARLHLRSAQRFAPLTVFL